MAALRMVLLDAANDENPVKQANGVLGRPMIGVEVSESAFMFTHVLSVV
jgi:hypothetical protein